MKCICCGSTDFEEMVLIASPGGKVRAVKEISKNRFEKNGDKKVVAFVCVECGHIEFVAKSFEKYEK